MVGTLGPQTDTGPVAQPETAALLLLLRDLQALLPPYALDPLAVHVPASLVEQSRYRPISVAAILARQLDDIRRQLRLNRPPPRHLPLGGAMLAERAAGAPLGYAKRLPHVVDALTSARGAQKFPRAASLRIILSRVRSETARLGRAFSFSSSFRRFN